MMNEILNNDHAHVYITYVDKIETENETKAHSLSLIGRST